MDLKLIVTVLSCIFIIQASATEGNEHSSKTKETNQDLKTAESSRFPYYFGGSGGRYPWNTPYYSNGNNGHGYNYPYPNSWQNNQYYPYNGGYPGFQYPNYNGGYPGGYPGGYSSGADNNYNGNVAKYRDNRQPATQTTAQGAYVY